MNYRILITTLIGLMLAGASVARPVSAQPPLELEIPTSVQSCVEMDQVKQIDLLGTANEGSTAYYRLLTTDLTGKLSTPLVALGSDKTCKSLITMDQSLKEFTSLQKYVSLETAQSLALQELDRFITKAGGKEQYQRALAEHLADPEEDVYLAPEEVWALKQRGIALPQNYFLIDPEQPVTWNE